MNLEKLTVPLELNKSDFIGGLKSVAGIAAVGFAGIAATAGIVAVGIKKAVDATVKWGDELDALQDVTNLTNAEAAGLNILLRKHGVSAETAAKSFTFLNKNLVEYDGQLGSTGKALKNWGINVKNSNGTLKTNAELTQEMANTYRRLQPGAERIAFLTETFGKSSTELNDALIELADKGMDSFIEKAKRLGLDLDADKIQQFKQQSEETKLMMEALGISIGSKVIPVLQEAQTQFARIINTPEFQAAMDIVLQALTDFGTYILTNLPIWTTEFLDFVNDAKGFYENTFIPAVQDAKDELILFGTTIDVVRQMQKDGMVDNDRYGQSFQTSIVMAVVDTIGIFESFRDIVTDVYTILDLLNTNADGTGKKFSILNSVIYVGLAKWLDVTDKINKARQALEWIDDRLRDVIEHWSQLQQLGVFIGNSIFGTANNPMPFGNPNVVKGQSKRGRATGGATIAGQSYNILELGKAEVFTSNQSGRIDPMETRRVEATFNETLLGNVIVSGLTKVLG